MSETLQFCTFFVGGHMFGIDVANVQEVLLPQALTPVPLAAAAVRGLLNLRGQIVTAIDLRTQLGLEARAGDALPMSVVVRVQGSTASLLADEIGDVVDVLRADIEPPPETLRGSARALVSGVCRLQGRLLLTLDVQRTLEVGPG